MAKQVIRFVYFLIGILQDYILKISIYLSLKGYQYLKNFIYLIFILYCFLNLFYISF